MKSKTISILGKEVTLGYCHATEIGYNLMSDEDVSEFFSHAVACLQDNTMPDIRKTIYMIIAAVNAYSEWKEEQAAITDRELMYEADPVEIGTALGTILQLRADFYHLPTSEPTGDESEGEEQKNA
jgi:cell division protein ZapA (FtsZ GTPase activity inhibitor)